jgi:glycosyltransferase involved in cell wall biosynthesis
LKTILFSSDSSSRGGKERQFSILTSELIKRGYKVYIAIKPIQINNNYFSEYDVPLDNIFTYNCFSQFKMIIKELRPDIAVSWDIISSAYHLITHRIYQYQFINGSIRQGIRHLKWFHLLRTLLAWLSPFVMANTQIGLKANNLKIGKRNFVLHNGVDNKFSKIMTDQEKKELLNRIFPNYRNKPGIILISVARLVPYKDHYTILKALSKLKYLKVFYYLVIGDGPLKSEMTNVIKDLGLDEYVKLVGLVNNVEDYLAVSDYYVHSSRGEGMSNSILEAMYAGLPIIATDVGGVRETVFKESSILFPYKDYEKLYEILINVEDLFKSFDPYAKCYRNHLHTFSVEYMIAYFEDIIQYVSDIK